MTPDEALNRRALLLAILRDEEPMYVTALAFMEDALGGPVVSRVRLFRALSPDERDELEVQTALKTAELYEAHALQVAPELNHRRTVRILALVAAASARRFYERAAAHLDLIGVDNP